MTRSSILGVISPEKTGSRTFNRSAKALTAHPNQTFLPVLKTDTVLDFFVYQEIIQKPLARKETGEHQLIVLVKYQTVDGNILPPAHALLFLSWNPPQEFLFAGSEGVASQGATPSA